MLYQDTWTCDFKVINDRPPQVRFLNRETNIEAGFGQTVPLYFSAEDDFGIDRLAVTVSVNDRKATIKEFRYDLPPQSHVKEVYSLKIIPGLFPPGGSAEINIVAIDNHLPGQTGITPVPVTIHVVDLVEKLKENIGQGRDSKLYELLFQAISQQQSIRGWVSVQLSSFRKNEAFRLSNDQKNIKNPNQAAGGGGGSGAYANIYYSSYGAITSGTVVNYTVGSSGSGGYGSGGGGGNGTGGNGANGRIKITWT